MLKNKLFTTAAVCGYLLIGFSLARAEDGNPPDQQDHQDDSQQGGIISGNENADSDVAFVPTADAPLGSGATAKLESNDEHGTTSALLKLETKGLADGTYTLNYTTLTDGTSNVIGTFTLSTTPPVPVTVTPDDSIQGSPNDSSVDVNEGEDSKVVFGTVEHPFPSGFDPFNVATLSISDANSVVLLTADLTDPDKAIVNANVRAHGGTRSPFAKGRVEVSATLNQGKVHGFFLLTAKNLPTKTPVVLNLNGKDVIFTSTDNHGQLRLKKMVGANPRVGNLRGVNFLKLHTISLHDKKGHELLHANL